MAFDATPTTTIPSYASDGTTISFDIADLTDLDSSDADATTGDIRKILFRLVDQIFNVWDALSTPDKSTKVTIQKTKRLQGDNQLARYTIEFKTAGILDVIAE